MNVFDQRKTLESMTILVDSREQDTDRARRRYQAFGVPYEKATLSYGDYTYTATLPDGSRVHDPDHTVAPVVAIERKMNLDELAACFTYERKRFQKEFERASANACRVYLIVENATWENLYNGKYRSRYHPNAFVASLGAWMVRYNAEVLFCKEETTGRLIKDILYRDLKERLERGEFG